MYCSVFGEEGCENIMGLLTDEHADSGTARGWVRMKGLQVMWGRKEEGMTRERFKRSHVFCIINRQVWAGLFPRRSNLR